MVKHLVIMSSAAALALAAGVASADTLTSKSGNSVSTTTQEGGGPVRQKVIKTPDGQKVITKSGGNSSTVSQSSGSSSRSKGDDPMEGDCDKPAKGKSKKANADDDEDCPDNLSLLDENMRERRRALDSSDRHDPRRFGRGFERAQALKDWMDSIRRQ